jgi:hypothetical protein
MIVDQIKVASGAAVSLTAALTSWLNHAHLIISIGAAALGVIAGYYAIKVAKRTLRVRDLDIQKKRLEIEDLKKSKEGVE